MTHLKDHIEILKNVLQDVCTKGATVPKANIYALFKQRQKTDIEFYRFSKEMSEIIQCGQIQGYRIKVGRNGGIVKDEPLINVRLCYNENISENVYQETLTKNVSQETLTKIISLMKTKGT